MYDTVIMELHKSDAIGINFINDVSPLLSNPKEGIIDGRPFTEGYLGKNLKVRCTRDWVKIPNGNIRGYYFENPFFDFCRSSFEGAITSLSDELHLPMHKSRVKRIDFGPTISLKYNPELYYKYYGDINNYKRLDQTNGVTWKGSKDQLIIYWKQNQLHETNKYIPKDKVGRNHIRTELRVSKRLGDYFGETDLRAERLYCEYFYINICDKWVDRITQIQKAGDPISKVKIFPRKKDTIEYLASMAISNLSPIELSNAILEAQKKGEIRPKQAYDLKQSISQLQKQAYQENKSDLVEELNEKIERAKAFYK
jgi:hypothetical protein